MDGTENVGAIILDYLHALVWQFGSLTSESYWAPVSMLWSLGALFLTRQLSF